MALQKQEVTTLLPLYGNDAPSEVGGRDPCWPRRVTLSFSPLPTWWVHLVLLGKIQVSQVSWVEPETPRCAL